VSTSIILWLASEDAVQTAEPPARQACTGLDLPPPVAYRAAAGRCVPDGSVACQGRGGDTRYEYRAALPSGGSPGSEEFEMSVLEQSELQTAARGGAPPVASAAGQQPPATAPRPAILEFLGWLKSGPRSYADTMEAWQTSCPRNSVWEDALGDALIQLENEAHRPMGESSVTLTPRGRALLAAAEGADASAC